MTFTVLGALEIIFPEDRIEVLIRYPERVVQFTKKTALNQGLFFEEIENRIKESAFTVRSKAKKRILPSE